MGHIHRFYISPDTPTGSEVALSSEEAHHALRVARVRPGDDIALFDGTGRIVEGAVARAERGAVVVDVHEERRAAPAPYRLTLIQAWLNRTKPIEEVIRRGTELGVTSFCFFRAERSDRAPKAAEKWPRLAIEVCKQCGRAFLPEFATAPSLEAALDADTYDAVLIATADLEPVPIGRAVSGARVALMIGPEGDFSEAELTCAQRFGAKPIALGAATLRSEAAAAAAATLVLYELGGLGPR